MKVGTEIPKTVQTPCVVGAVLSMLLLLGGSAWGMSVKWPPSPSWSAQLDLWLVACAIALVADVWGVLRAKGAVRLFMVAMLAGAGIGTVCIAWNLAQHLSRGLLWP